MNQIEKPKVYTFLKRVSGLDTDELYNTFNMGIGMMVVVDKQDAPKLIQALAQIGEKAKVIGDIVPGDKGVILCQD
jgi:phosphoribosylformylglycinamidine cyclo-ligase